MFKKDKDRFHPLILQPIETGVISKINIKEGDFVKKGQVLMQIDPSVTENNLGNRGQVMNFHF